MVLTALGLNHDTAPLTIRERLAIVPEQMPNPLYDFIEQTNASEAVILSTCNRVEYYSTLEHQADVMQWLAQRYQISIPELQQYTYLYRERDAVKHMLRVASGVDSMVLGEPQILGQMKQAFTMAQSANTIGPQLSKLFQHVFSVSKKIRTETNIGANPVTMAFAAIDLAKHIFANLAHTRALLIGAGETIELMLRYLKQNQVKELWVANRTLAKAEQVAEQFGAHAVAFNDINTHLAHADIVISATAAALPILGKGSVESALKQRRHKPILMLDLAVPRDIEPEVAQLGDVYLYCLDDLKQIIDQNLQDRRQRAAQAEAMIEFQTECFMQWLNSLDAVNLIRNYRDKMISVRDEQITKAQRMLRLGATPEEVIVQLGRSLTNKFMHNPTITIKQAATDENADLLDAAKVLLALDE